MKTLEVLVNPFGKLESESPDNITTPNFGKDELLERVWNYFHSFDGKTIYYGEDPHYYSPLMRHVSPLNLDFILTPAQISVFFEQLKNLPRQMLHKNVYAGLFVSRLINNSYQNENNHFVIDTGDKFTSNLVVGLNGEKDNPLEITINGFGGDYLGQESKNSIIRVKGSVDNQCGGFCDNLNVTVEGNAGGFFGYNSKNSFFEIFGDVGDVFGSDAEKSTFIVHNRKAYDTFKKNIRNRSKVILRE